MFTKVFNYLKDLRKQPKKTREAVFFWVMFAVVPLIVFFLAVSVKLNIEKAVVNPGQEPSFGEKIFEIVGGFFSKVWQGLSLIFQSVSEFFQSEKFRDFLRSVFGKPRIEVLSPGQEINLPQATE